MQCTHHQDTGFGRETEEYISKLQVPFQVRFTFSWFIIQRKVVVINNPSINLNTLILDLMHLYRNHLTNIKTYKIWDMQDIDEGFILDWKVKDKVSFPAALLRWMITYSSAQRNWKGWVGNTGRWRKHSLILLRAIERLASCN